MPDLLDRIYCSEQIHIPPSFPYIMKIYCKAAIRTQPYDLLKWSAAYFRALANGEEPPVKERIEYPPYDSPSGLTPGYIKILVNQFGKDPATVITAQTLFKKWSDICLGEELLIRLIALLGATTTLNWVKFVGVCAGFISNTLSQTMILICEIFTEEPEGGMASIPYDLFIDLYMFLAQMECGPLTEKEKDEIDKFLMEDDICHVAEKIKQGVYEGEEYEESEYKEKEEEVIEAKEEEMTLSKIEEEEEAASTSKDAEQLSIVGEEEGAEMQGEEEEKLVEPSEKDEIKASLPSIPHLDKTSVKSTHSLAEETNPDLYEGEGEAFGSQVVEEEVSKEEETMMDSKGSYTRRLKRIALDDLNDSVRAKIEEKLMSEEEEEAVEEEESRKEFDDLMSYLIGAATRVQKFTAEALGFRIFKKYMRQEIPGIGPYVDTDQVEAVVNFMDCWSHKQETMIMPRNIRHWMCPPLDKIPPPEP